MSRDPATDEIDFSADLFDIRDVIARVEYLEAEAETETPAQDSPESEELAKLTAFLSEVCGRGGDEQWRGDWYPVTFILDSYFEDAAKSDAEDMYGSEISEAKWPFNCIDWEKAAAELQMDYTEVNIDGNTYWFR